MNNKDGYNVQLPFMMDACPRWWQNYANSATNEDRMSILARDYDVSAIMKSNVEGVIDYLVFPSEEAFCFFKLKWS